jgi:hypothetical protein
VVAYFLLEKWLLSSVFVTPMLDGLIKDFVLPKNCTANLQMMF